MSVPRAKPRADRVSEERSAPRVLNPDSRRLDKQEAAAPEATLRARRARLDDAAAIHRLIASYAEAGLLLPRSEEEIRAHIERFLVLKRCAPSAGADPILGCVALEPYGNDLAEIRSLAVAHDHRGCGAGARLLAAVLAAARQRGIARVFAVTHAPEFFWRHGFTSAERQAIPEKMERDCRSCPKARRCRLVAVVAATLPGQLTLPAWSAGEPSFTP